LRKLIRIDAKAIFDLGGTEARKFFWKQTRVEGITRKPEVTRAVARSLMQIDEPRTFPKRGANPMGNIVHGKTANPFCGSDRTFNDVMEVLEIFSGCKNARHSLKFTLRGF
jgi:hypothetical protein